MTAKQVVFYYAEWQNNISMPNPLTQEDFLASMPTPENIPTTKNTKFHVRDTLRRNTLTPVFGKDAMSEMPASHVLFYYDKWKTNISGPHPLTAQQFTASTNPPPSDKQSYRATCERLIALYPNTLDLRNITNPLAIGTHKTLATRHRDIPTSQIRNFLAWTSSRPRYLHLILCGIQRMTLDGLPAERITDEQKSQALKVLTAYHGRSHNKPPSARSLRDFYKPSDILPQN